MVYIMYVHTYSLCQYVCDDVHMCLYRYSCNEGMSWTDFNFTDGSIALWGISTKPGETSTQVLLVTSHYDTEIIIILYHLNRVFGHPSNATSSWIITHINFTSIFYRSCEDSDYYYWTVSDGVSYYMLF